MNGNLNDSGTCSDCGLPRIDDGLVCQVVFDQILAQHFENAVYFGAHRLFVDTYCMQHPDQGCISFKSFAAHAAHLCWSVERGGSQAVPSEAIRRWVERNPHLEKPMLPRHRGTMTIAEVAGLEPAMHREAVWRWAQDVWAAYRGLHVTIRNWVDLALAAGRHEAEPSLHRTGAQPAGRRERMKSGR